MVERLINNARMINVLLIFFPASGLMCGGFNDAETEEAALILEVVYSAFMGKSLLLRLIRILRYVANSRARSEEKFLRTKILRIDSHIDRDGNLNFI